MNTVEQPGASSGPVKIRVKCAKKDPIPPVPTFEVSKTITAADNISSAIKDVLDSQNKNKKKISSGTVPELCTECRDILPNFMIPHAPSSCPVRNALHCGFCSRYGHTSKTCSVAPPPWAKDIQYLEQLIPTDDLKRLGISSRTPLAGKGNVPELTSKIPNDVGTIEIKEDDRIIKAWLRARGIPATENPRRNKELLQQFADRQGKVLVYLP